MTPELVYKKNGEAETTDKRIKAYFTKTEK